MSNPEIVGVVSRNSISYVQTLFKCYQNQQIAVLLRRADDVRIRQTGVTRVVEPDDAKGWFNAVCVFPRDDTLAQIAFTSGTEGEPKGVLLTHRALADVTERLNQVMEVDGSIREYVGVPANFSFGLGRFRAVAAAGGASYLPPHGFDPLEIRELLQAGEINAASAVPSLWRILLENRRLFGTETAEMKWIEIGSQYMSRREKEQLKALFPNAVIVQHYGLTEASRTTFLRIDQAEGEALESVGRVYGQSEVRISGAGRICIRGPHVARQLLKNDHYVPNVDEEGWLQTSDLGHLRDGYLYYDGRADDLINCGGIKLSPEALERDLRDQLNLSEGLAVAAVNDPLTGDGVLIATLRHQEIDEAVLLDAAGELLLTCGINNKRVIKRLTLDAFPVTDTKKVRRRELAREYAKRVETASPEASRVSQPVTMADLSNDERKILSIWRSVLATDQICVEDNFYGKGGDSLSALMALIEMERQGVPANSARGLLQGLSIREIARGVHSADSVDRQQHRLRRVHMGDSKTNTVESGAGLLGAADAKWVPRQQGLLRRILRYLAFERGRAADWYRRLCGPDGDEWAAYLKRRGGLYAMGERCSINTDVVITDPAYTRLGNNVRLTGCILFGHDGSVNMLNCAYGVKLDRVGKVDIRDNVFVGHGAIILPGVTIGPNAIVAAGSVVNHDVPPGSIVAGVPARVVGEIDWLVTHFEEESARMPWIDALNRYRETGDPALRVEVERARIRHFFGHDGA